MTKPPIDWNHLNADDHQKLKKMMAPYRAIEEVGTKGKRGGTIGHSAMYVLEAFFTFKLRRPGESLPCPARPSPKRPCLTLNLGLITIQGASTKRGLKSSNTSSSTSLQPSYGTDGRAIGTTLMGRMGYGARAGAGGTEGRDRERDTSVTSVTSAVTRREAKMSNTARITTIANYIIDKAEAGWSLQDILETVHAERSGVTEAEVQAALKEAYEDDTSTAVKRLAVAEFERLVDETWQEE
jgi:hypothetical protein